MTAKATPSQPGEWSVTCNECPQFTPEPGDQRTTVHTMRQHDRSRHPQMKESSK